MTLTTENFQKWITSFSQKIIEKKKYLSELDTPIGDGDHGNNMARGVKAIQDSLKSNKPKDLKTAFRSVAMALISKVGGASGPLYGTAFLEMAKKSTDAPNLADLLDSALKGVKMRGAAKQGDKTMVDVWEPVISALKKNKLTQKVIDDSINSTKDMVAKKGRASYLGKRSTGHLDPGAVSSGYLFTSLLNTKGIL